MNIFTEGRDDEDEENLRPRDPVRASRKTFVYKKPERLLEKVIFAN